MADPQPNDRVGMLRGIVDMVRSLNLFNVLVIALMLVILVPTYVTYRIINDDALLDRFLSSYSVYGRPISSCTVHKIRQRGEPYTWVISRGFAFEGGTRWSMAVALSFEPNDEQVVSYCGTLEQLVDHMRKPEGPSPTFPGTDKEVVVPYKSGGGPGEP